MSRTMIALSMLLLLGPAPVAAKDCAWVLWQYSSIDQAERWAPQDSFATRDQCDIKKNGRLEVERKYWNSQNGVARAEKDPLRNSLRIYFETGEGPGHIRFICLVDTVDPRGENAFNR